MPRPLAIVDLDGVVADVRHRLHHLTGRRKDWDAFFAAAPDDPPHPEGLAVVQRLEVDHDVIYLTGRPERCRRGLEPCPEPGPRDRRPDSARARRWASRCRRRAAPW